MKSLIITINGDDRAGIVEELSRIIVEHGGEWIESRMANLCGKFAGILRVNLPDEQTDLFETDVQSSLYDQTVNIQEARPQPSAAGHKFYHLQLVGHDRPGIIHSISALLVKNGATVEELDSEVVDASMSGEKLFKATITVSMSGEHSIEKLGEALENLANELIVDIEFG